MDTSALQYFAVAASLEHMGKAAEQLNITQPSLSVSIRRLEAEIGYKLFVRDGRGVRLNEFGKIFLKGVLEAENSLATALHEMESYKSSINYLVKLSCSGSATNSKLIDMLMEKGIGLKMSHIPRNWEEMLLNKQSDFVITMGVLHNEQIGFDNLAYQELVFVVGTNHPLAQNEELELEQLKQYAFCSTDAPYSLVNVLKEQRPEYEFQPKITFFGRNSADMLKAIQTGHFIGLMVKKHLPQAEDIRILPVKNVDITLPINLYWRKNSILDFNLEKVRADIIEFYSEN